jgi:long-chain acyl-CoA synthetase
MNLSDFLRNTATRVPDTPAIRFGERALTYSELDRGVDHLAHGFRALGIKPGDRCVLMMPNSVDWVHAYYALARLGAVIVPVNPVYRKGELKHIFSDSGAHAFLGHSDYLAEAVPVIESLGELSIRLVEGSDVPPGFLPLDDFFQDAGGPAEAGASEGDPFAIIYTSGTTGLPKGAVLTHGNFIGNVESLAGLRKHQPGDVVLCALPLFHIFGQIHALNLSVYAGLTIRMWDHFEAEEVIEAIEKEKSTVLYAVPAMINRLVDVASYSPPERSSLRFCVSGEAPLSVEALEQFEEAFGTSIIEGYGLTECTSTCLENRPGRTRAGSIGFPTPGFHVRIVGENGRNVPVGEVGELIIQGPGVMKGYLNQPEATRETLRGGWLHTGDLARADRDSYIYFVDRKKPEEPSN